MIPSEASPEPVWPPIASAANITSPSEAENRGRNHLDLVNCLRILLQRMSSVLDTDNASSP